MKKTRFKLCQEILKVNPIVELSQKTFIKDKSYLVRSKLAENIHRIDNSDNLISILQRDKSGLVRQKCLESRIKIDEERDKIDFREFLFDRSGTIRNLAKYYSKLSNEEVIDIYRNAIKSKNSIEVSIYGLGELGRKSDVDLILPFVDSKQTKLKKAAIRTIMKFDSSLITNQIIEELDSMNKSIRKLAIECLSNTSDKRILNRCREIYKTGTTELKISMLSFFGRNCTYKTLPDVILPLNDELEEIRNSAWSHLDNWRLRSISNYSKQTEEDRKRAREIYSQIKFKNRLPYAREKLWKELPYFGRFKDE